MKRPWIVLIVVLFTLIGGMRASRSRRVAGDFLRYHRAGRLVATDRADKLYDKDFLRSQQVYAEERAAEVEDKGKKADRLLEKEFKYLPSTAVLMAPFGALHPRWGNALWGAWNAFLLAVGFWGAWHVCARGIPKKWLLVPIAVLAHVANDNLNLGQINPSAIFPGVLGLLALSRAVEDAQQNGWWKRNRFNVTAGLLVGFGTIVKFYPGVIGLWMLWRRRWVAFGFWLIGIVMFGGVLPAAVFGPAKAVDLTNEYIAIRLPVYTQAKRKDVPGYSIKSFVYRTFGDVPFVKKGSNPFELRTNVASLPPETLKAISLIGNLVAVALFLVVVGWGRLRGPPGHWDALQGGLLLTTVVLISPEARGPHFLYLMLGVVALTGVLARNWEQRRETWYRVAVVALVICALLVNSSSKSLFGEWLSYRLSAYCAMGFGAVALFVALAVALTVPRTVSLRRGPLRLPAETPAD